MSSNVNQVLSLTSLNAGTPLCSDKSYLHVPGPYSWDRNSPLWADVDFLLHWPLDPQTRLQASSPWPSHFTQKATERLSRVTAPKEGTCMYTRGFPVAQGKRTCLQWRSCSRLRFNPWVGRSLEEGRVTRSRTTLAWRVPWTEEPGRVHATESDTAEGT